MPPELHLAPHVQSVRLRCGGNVELQCLNDGTCGRASADSCAGVTPYCSVWAVGYDISCGSSDPWILVSGVHVRARLSRSARVKGFCVLGFFKDLASQHRPKTAGATRREECDDGIDLVG